MAKNMDNNRQASSSFRTGKDGLDQRDPSVFYLVSTAVIVTCLKLMLVPAYYSTDFEVHRNWMAITSNLPISQWYSEATSQWTLDYPPFFAYFELLLSHFAPWFDSSMLKISAEPYTSPSTVFYQRLTVIVSDLVYYYATYVWLHLLATRFSPLAATRTNLYLASTTFVQVFLHLFHVGHLLVDHIHFQYNGLLNGLLLLSMARVVRGEIYWGAFWFAVLLNFKHIYLYMAPAYFLYLLLQHCLEVNPKRGHIKPRFLVLVNLGAIVLGVFALSFGPFWAKGQLGPLLGRLFPFQRGLCHAYWAPNVWALYNGADLVLAKLLKVAPRGANSSYTGGLVQQSEHLVLPSISPTISLALVGVTLLFISLLYLRKRLTQSVRVKPEVHFLHLLLLSALTFFELGYHVHEKAILVVLPPLLPLIFLNIHYARLFILLSTTGFFSLFPLLYKEAETPIKILLLLIHVTFALPAISSRYESLGLYRKSSWLVRLAPLSRLESLYLLGLIPLQLFYSLGPYVRPEWFDRYQFVPLMLVSLYCALAILYAFVKLLWLFARREIV